MTDFAVERLPPDEAFDLLAHETRFEILEALNGAADPMRFSELRDAVGVRDSGQFNYHLGKLVGRFVREDDEGYRLSRAGKRVLGAVYSGGYTHVHDADPVPMSTACPDCGAAMEARFGAERVTVGCSACDFVYTSPDIPPGVLEGWVREDVPAVVHRYVRRQLSSLDSGLCPYCDGRTDTVVCRPGDDAAPDWFTEADADRDAVVVYECRRCDHWMHAMVEFAALVRSAVVGFHHEHGIDLRETPAWELDWNDEAVAGVTAADPLRVAVPITLDGETRRFVFDRSMDLVETDRA